jgi:DNA-binding CsgD family transcriptional regulator
MGETLNVGGVAWQKCLALAVCAGDWSVAGIARYAEVSPAVANRVRQSAVAAGVIDDAGHINEMECLALVAGVSTDDQGRVHTLATRHLAGLGTDHHRELLRHARAASSVMDANELVAVLDHAGELSLVLGAYSDASELLALADELDVSGDQSSCGQRLCLLAAAVDGTGDVETARRHLSRALSAASLAGDDALVARAAVQYALPVDWYAGDERAAGFLHRAAQGNLEPGARVSVEAARALVEMRIPLIEDDGQQAAWITRPGVAQPMAQKALAASVGLPHEARVLALLAWRGTHRAPEFLERRLEASTEAFDLAQQLRDPVFQVDSGVWLAVDAYEAGDRATYDRTVAMVRWVAGRDGNPRLRWRSLTLAAGQALLDGDIEGAAEARREATLCAERANLPGTRAAELFFLGQEAISANDTVGLEMVCTFGEMSLANNPLAMAGLAYAHAKVGDPAVAARLAQQALDRCEPEGSLLLVATRVAAVATELQAPELAQRVIGVLSPWRGRCSVDSNGWWCDGLVEAWLVLLHQSEGDDLRARELLPAAWKTAESSADRRTLDRLSPLHEELGGLMPTVMLSPRQLAVLELVAAGATNAEVAKELNFSVSTTRLILTSLYDLFGTRNRRELAEAASAAGVELPQSLT